MPPTPRPPALRVVSLLPAATEMLSLIGGEHLLVGRSHECDYPASVLSRPAVTRAAAHDNNADQTSTAASPRAIDDLVRAALASGTPLTTLDTRLLADLRPDIILTQDLCGVCAVDESTLRAVAAALPHPPRIVTLTAQTVEGMLDDLATVGQAVGLDAPALDAAVALRERLFRAAEFVNPYTTGPVVGFLEWTDPLFIAGHWTVQLIERAGGRHPLNPTVPTPDAGAAAGPQHAQAIAGPSIRIAPELFAAARPDALIICPCGLSLDQTRRAAADLAREAWFAGLPAVRARRVAIVDGHQMFNRAGPRLADAFEWLVGWLNNRPELMPPGFPWEPLP